MRSAKRIASVVFPLLAVGFTVGCGSATNLAPVTGTVTYQGKPLEQGAINFYPKQGRPTRGTIKDGKIVEVTSFQPGDGAPIGELKVAVQSVKPDYKDKSGMATISILPAKYGDPATSGLSATIERGKQNTLVFELTD